MFNVNLAHSLRNITMWTHLISLAMNLALVCSTRHHLSVVISSVSLHARAKLTWNYMQCVLAMTPQNHVRPRWCTWNWEMLVRNCHGTGVESPEGWQLLVQAWTRLLPGWCVIKITWDRNCIWKERQLKQGGTQRSGFNREHPEGEACVVCHTRMKLHLSYFSASGSSILADEAPHASVCLQVPVNYVTCYLFVYCLLRRRVLQLMISHV